MNATQPGGAPQAATPERTLFVRSIYAGRDLELFMVTAVATILLVRAILAATGWPQLGGGKIHFAHLLWGGLGMLIALVLFMAMQGRIWRQLAVFAAGIGFGLFIDELGKFITADNDYFFEPVIALIYIVFVILFIISRALVGSSTISPQSALVNAFDLAKEAVIRDMDEREQTEALAVLARCNQADPLVQQLTAMVTDMRDLVKGTPQPYQRLKHWLRRVYDSLVRRRWFKGLIIGWYVFFALVSLVSAFVPLVVGGLGDLSFAEQGHLASSAAAGALVAIGVVRWRWSRLAAYRWFERAILVTLFLAEFFSFYLDQFGALWGLFFTVLTYMTLRLLISQEQARLTQAQAAHSTAATPSPA